MKSSTTKDTLRIYWQHAKRYKRQLWTIYPSMVVAQLAEDMVEPLLISGLLSKLASGNTAALTMDKVWPILLTIAFIELFSNTLWNFIVRIFWRTQERIMCDIKMTVFDHLSTMSYRFFSDRFAGSLVNQANRFVGAFERVTDPLTWNVFKLLVAIIFT